MTRCALRPLVEEDKAQRDTTPPVGLGRVFTRTVMNAIQNDSGLPQGPAARAPAGS
jgi:hypothetical protein